MRIMINNPAASMAVNKIVRFAVSCTPIIRIIPIITSKIRAMDIIGVLKI